MCNGVCSCSIKQGGGLSSSVSSNERPNQDVVGRLRLLDELETLVIFEMAHRGNEPILLKLLAWIDEQVESVIPNSVV